MANLFSSWLLMSLRISSHPEIGLRKTSEYIRTVWLKTESAGTVKHMEGITLFLTPWKPCRVTHSRLLLPTCLPIPIKQLTLSAWLIHPQKDNCCKADKVPPALPRAKIKLHWAWYQTHNSWNRWELLKVLFGKKLIGWNSSIYQPFASHVC